MSMLRKGIGLPSWQCTYFSLSWLSVVAGKFSHVLEPFHPTNEDLDILSHVLEF
ncbi:hypothetical protein HanPSC8_Chr10g0418461 [Helianthus annuus]|nr:hypothetical protein HanPSC8_Chr10g0418461 [Helianthus annuus]